ncbi:MAG: 16S rRNA (guanine(527)-N(7))-methyltransferase RsmG [Clostridiales bacterium]|jgi:16S rRNA (guanine527-N7)-methyltransferase|nr:16S rRNA (guanine(527)-N(7))-methyltransferase RsmG [Clostridiales bacterium]
MSATMSTLIERYIPQADADAARRLTAYSQMLLTANTHMNLTAITDPEEIVLKHFVDSLTASPYIPQGARCIDVGTGAGFPGIPLLIMRPAIGMTLMDSTQKRVGFLTDTTAKLGLEASCVCARAETLSHDVTHREQYDIALARAVAPLRVLLEICTPFVKPGGVFIAYRGKHARDESNEAGFAANILHCRIKLVPLTVSYGARTLALVEKLAPTPSVYPRKAGDPARKPL